MICSGRESLLVAFCAGAAAATVVAAGLWPRKKKDIVSRKSDEDAKSKITLPEALIKEQLARNIKFFGEHGYSLVRKAFVIVVGVGGVGSHCAHLLARSGVAKIRIIDFDQVTLSSLNRHAVATHADVGLPKVEVMRNHFAGIAPFVEVEAYNELFQGDRADVLLGGNPDFVIDCIDNTDTKADLIQYCLERSIPIISSMASGARADPTHVRIGNINDVEYDELATHMRNLLRRRGMTERIDLPVVFSTERSRMKLSPLEGEQADDPKLYQTVDKFRVRIMPVVAPVPACFGNTLAAAVLSSIAKMDFKPVGSPISVSRNHYNRVVRDLHRREIETYKAEHKCLKWDFPDFKYVFEEVWRGKSVISGRNYNTVMVRWDKSKPTEFTNLVVLTCKEADEFDQSEGPSSLSMEVRERVEAGFDHIRHWSHRKVIVRCKDRS